MKKIILTKENAEKSASIINYLMNDLKKENDDSFSEMKSGILSAFADAYLALRMVDEDGITFEFPDDIAKGDVFGDEEHNEAVISKE